MTDGSPVRIVDLSARGRERALPVLIDSFVGIYRWHAKRTLRDVTLVRGAEVGGELGGVALLELLTPEVGYVYYIAVAPRHRRSGVGGTLLEDAMRLFADRGARIAYAAVEEDNAASLALFRSRLFRRIGRGETNYKEGGLGAWGLRSRMRLVWGEVLLGRWVDATRATSEREAPSS